MNELYRDATLGDMIRERRTTLGMTMRELAGTTLSPTAVNNIEKGKINPTVDTLLYLCEALQLAPEQGLVFYPDITKSAAALLQIVEKKMEVGQIDESIALLYDIYWVATEQSAPDELIAKVQYKLGIAFARLGRFESARNVMNEAYKHYLIHRDIAGQIRCLNQLGNYSLAERHINISISTFRQAVELAHRYQLTDEQAGETLINLANAYFVHGDLDEALYFHQRADLLFRQLNDADNLNRNRIRQAVVLVALERADEAYELSTQAHDYFAARQDNARLAEALRVLGDILCHREEHAASRETYLQALELQRGVDPELVFLVETRISHLELKLGHTALARRYARSALGRLREPHRRARVYKLLAQCDYQSRDIEGYIDHMTHAHEAMLAAGDGQAAALIQCEIADETNDLNLMRSATRTLRQLYEDRHRHDH
ncbi:helix-turn-helix domain-containing protein [Tumebacillus sp. DT12]|uniref:Helix-turn-helix domain-containing protein n=1 Tax=Tumebacillus lacus TaxID=2995335 RepID=A0ABT3X994_9BACL|nr:helix-turn-helix domain-containing protein [Tumebacillus lacus]MCX7572185.1 helix-turn-helix domain-containing protein [Tumebacillus lacus]